MPHPPASFNARLADRGKAAKAARSARQELPGGMFAACLFFIKPLNFIY
jgi:hypothetical protein